MIQTLEECIALADRLTVLMEQDNAEIRNCIQGDLLTEYLKGSEKAAEMVRSLRNTLVLLKQEETEALLLQL